MRLFLAVIAASALVAAVVSVAPGQRTDTIAIGVNVAGGPGDMTALQQYARLAGRTPALVMWYQQWSEPLFYPMQLRHVASLGALPVITWDPEINGIGIPLQAVAAGRYDAYIRASADAAARWRRPIYIRFAHEMNLKGSPFGPGHPGDSPRQFIEAWRHVLRIFREQRATNVEWIWSPNTDCEGRCPFTAYYPGNRWVDWAALDGYNYSTVAHVRWMSFVSIFSASYRILTRISDRPLMIAETASAPSGGNKANWIARAFREIPQVFPRIHALTWFDRIKEANWTVNSSSASLQTWRHVVRSARYACTPSALLHLAPFRRDVETRLGPR